MSGAIVAKAVNDTLGTDNFRGLNKDLQDISTQLSRIAGAMEENIYTKDWQGVRKAVKDGIAPNLFPVGTKFNVLGDVYVVTAHNHFKSVDDESAPTMTLTEYNAKSIGRAFDDRQSFYFGDIILGNTYGFATTNVSDEITELTGLQAKSTYGFEVGYSDFGLSDGSFDSAQKGYFRIGERGTGLSGYVDVGFRQYNNSAYTMKTASIQWDTGVYTVSGAFGGLLNDFYRSIYGGNNYYESMARQVINNNPLTNAHALNKFSSTYSAQSSVTTNEIAEDAEIMSVIGDVYIDCYTNSAYESKQNENAYVSTSYRLKEKFFLLSANEVGFDGGSLDNSSVLPYYKDASNSDRIKYYNGNGVNWLLRSPVSTDTTKVIAVDASGARSNVRANATSVSAISFNIV